MNTVVINIDELGRETKMTKRRQRHNIDYVAADLGDAYTLARRAP
jgi:hypothetical protein